jgi:predicted dehydrogenase
MIKVGIIGYGYWGPNLLRNFMQLDIGTVGAVADPRQQRLNLVKIAYPTIKTYLNAVDLIANNEIDAVVIATPVFSHFELARRALLSGKHVIIEKPMTSSASEAQELIDIALKKNLVLMVDHTFLYTGAVRKIQELIDTDTLGKLRYFDSTRLNLGLFQPDVNVLWDLAPHDISILSFLVSEKPYSINATGTSHTLNGIENIAYMTVNYASDLIAHFHCSWTSPVKIRQTLIGGDAKMIVYNDLEPSEKVRIYDTGYTHQTEEDKTRIQVDYRTGDISIPKLQASEALRGVAMDFIESIIAGRQPISTALLGLDVIKILEASQESIKNKGKEVKVK